MKDDFNKLDINPNIIKTLEKEGLKRTKEVQFKTLPLILGGYDVIATSPTQSGKTLSYVIALLQSLSAGAGLQSVIIVPTKEHAKKVEKTFKLFTRASSKAIKVLVSTEKSKTQEEKEQIMPKVDVLISTPLKLKELINEKNYDFTKVRILILDDVDITFEVEVFDQFNFILRNMPKKKQMVVFSTTISQEIYLKIRYWMRMPKRVTL